MNLDNIVVYQELDVPSAARIIKLQKCVNNPALFLDEYGSSGTYNILQVFDQVLDMFSKK